ncbi:unnamed protein product [Staurois parvus]|uniref:Uncharacterized protein n=1 Tax=Staurois parvus TaxID=386267 RepID=A0ABN9BBH0_9NEOB|nr:unnamed protein product [Staurois parvus]
MRASVFCVPFPATSGRTGTEQREISKCEKVTHSLNTLKSHNKTLLYQSISHTFCP